MRRIYRSLPLLRLRIVCRMAHLRKAFEKFDTDNSGTISRAELREACNSLGKSFTEAQLRQIMDRADSDGSGELDYAEFVNSIEGGHMYMKIGS